MGSAGRDLSSISLRGFAARCPEGDRGHRLPLVLDSARLYVRERFPDHQGALEAMLELLDLPLAPDPPIAEVAAHAGLVRDRKDIPVGAVQKVSF